MQRAPPILTGTLYAQAGAEISFVMQPGHLSVGI